MEIKICGIRFLEEVKMINELEPDYIGFVFAESKRKISLEKASRLKNNLKDSIKTVGVFRNNSIDLILEITNRIPLDIIQLHGDEDKKNVSDIKSKIDERIQIWKGICVKEAIEVEKYNGYDVDAFILDGSEPGSGEVFNWNIGSIDELNKAIFLAGGIKRENVDGAIERIGIRGIDVSSGVEDILEKGERIKSYIKMKELIERVREYGKGEI